MTAEVLRKNPDVYTYWNIRREAISLVVNVSFLPIARVDKIRLFDGLEEVGAG